MPEPTAQREPFDWLDDFQLRHGGLRMIQTAIARGWLEGPEHAEKRAKLVDALVKLADDPKTHDRDKLQACRLLVGSMTAANLRILESTLPRRPTARRRRMGRNRRGEGGQLCATGDAERGPPADRQRTVGRRFMQSEGGAS